MSLLLTLNTFTPFCSASIVDFEQVNVNWLVAGVKKFQNVTKRECLLWRKVNLVVKICFEENAKLFICPSESFGF